MLPRSARLSNSAEFRQATARGVRAGRPTVVVHAAFADPGRSSARVGFVVSRQVGNAVVRNRVKRRLRHLAAAQLPSTPAGVNVVVRALPRAASDPAAVVPDLASAWSRVLRKLDDGTPAAS